MPTLDVAPEVATLRAFNRFYTRKIGVLDGTASSPFSLAEARVLYELAHKDQPTATGMCKTLGLDPGYMSRILRDFERRMLLRRQRSTNDERQKSLSLTAKGQRVFAPLEERSNHDVAAMLQNLSAEERIRLVQAAHTIQKLLGDEVEQKAPYLLRTHRPGDLGWIVYRQALLYAEEYGWTNEYEALASEIIAQFIKQFDPQFECCWIAEKDGERVGGVFIAKASEEVAKLRLLHVEQSARGLGIGTRLVEECIRFSQRAGYKKITLWTQSILVAARHIYAKLGFQIVHQEKHHSFGKDLVAETWELNLRCTTQLQSCNGAASDPLLFSFS